MEDAFRKRKRFVEVNGYRMAVIDEGAGDAIVFLHGNPTSSYLWRNVMPHLAGRGRLIAPDLIGMGDSDKLTDSGPHSYTFAQHKAFLFDLLDALEIGDNVTLVIHDWGSALGFHWAHLNEARVRGIAFMEAIVAPFPDESALPNAFVQFLHGVRSPKGESMVLEQNMFVEGILPRSILRELSAEEMAEYRRPFLTPGEDRRPTLTWPRQIPIAGEPFDVAETAVAYAEWLGQSEIPKLFIDADPGAILRGEARDRVRGWPALTEVTVPGVHFVQEDSADAIGKAIADWLPPRG